MRKIAREAFAACRGLTAVQLPDSVTAIGEGAFRNCSALTEMALPEQLDSVDRGAFEGCPAAFSLSAQNVGGGGGKQFF